MVTHTYTHIHTHIHTYTHDNYYNPRCACAQRVNYVDIFTQALLMVTCLFFPGTAKDNKGIIMVIRTMKV